MRVLATGMEWFKESPGGLPRYLADYLEHWQRHGGEVRALVRTAGRAAGGTAGGNRAEATFPSYVRDVHCTQKNPLAVRQLWRSVISEELAASKYDLWNPHFAYYAWGAVHTRETKDLPVVTHFHGPWAYEAKVEHRGLLRQLRFEMQKAIEQRVYRSTDQFIVMSKAFRGALMEGYGVPSERIHIIPAAVDVERFQPTQDPERVRTELGLPTHRTVLVSVRRLVHRMGLERLVHAMRVLVGDFPNLLLVIVGTGELEGELRRLTAELGLDNHIWFTGRVPDEQLPKYYQAADLSVVPTMALEGFGLITAESLASGTPALGTPIGGTKELLQRFDSRLLLPGAGTAELVEGIGTALGHLRALPSAEACRAYVLRNYTWDIVIPQIKAVFESAVGSSRGLERGMVERNRIGLANPAWQPTAAGNPQPSGPLLAQSRDVEFERR